MISAKRILCIISLLTLFVSCKNDWESALAQYDKSLLYGNDHREWKLAQKIKSVWLTQYTVTKVDRDTLKVLFLSQGQDGKVWVSGYSKQYKLSDSDSAFLKMTSQDTLFFYRRHGDEKIFVVGEYAYRFTYFKMDSTEANYYLKHEDSLRQVRGNNLPKLPRD